MASAEFLEQALSTDVDENAVNAIVGSLENHLVTSVPSISSQNNLLTVIPSQLSLATSENTIIGQKYNKENSDGDIGSVNFRPNIVSSSSFSLPSTFINQTSLSQNISNGTDLVKVISSQPLTLSVSDNSVVFSAPSYANGCPSLPLSQAQIIQTVQGSSAINQPINKSITMQNPPLVIKQGTTSGQVSMQANMVPMTVNSSMPGSISNVMTINKPGGQNVVVTTQNLGTGQPAILPNVQILNMRPGAPAVAAQKSVATVSPRVVIGTPQVVGQRAAAPGITLQTLQSLQQGQQGHLLLKTENGHYQLLRVGPGPGASTLAPQQQTMRLSTVPAHPGVSTVSTSVPAPVQIPGQMPQGPVATPVPAASVTVPLPSPQSLQPTVTTQKPLDNTKEKCRNFLANLLDLSSKEPKSVERSVRNLIQELIDAQVEPEEFCDRLERLLNASPQPCLIGFLKKSLPLLRQSLVTKELVIEGINPPSPHVAFSAISPQAPNTAVATSNIQMPDDEGSSSPTLTPLLPPVMPVIPPQPPSPKQINIVAVQTAQPKPQPKSGGTIAVLQNIPVHPKINVSKVGKTMTVNSKAGFTRPTGSANTGLSTVLTAGKSLLRDRERRSAQFSQSFVDDKMAGDDDINDVAAMGGVNLAEESQRILGSTEMIGAQIRSCKDETLVPMAVMQARIRAVSLRHGLEEPPAEVGALLSHALQERLKSLLEKLAVISQHRIDTHVKMDSRYEVTQDVKGQLKFLEELDRVDKKRREDSEREMLLRAAKSRSKNEDPEQAKLKAKAKEMQRAELEELRQREANLTALQAIGPRKKPRTDGSAAGDNLGSSGQSTGPSGRGQLPQRTRLKRVNMRDMLFMMEQEPEYRHSALLYRAYLK
ncbi:transcription initiation factor TFIID subunit 4 isoform X3 [Danaus plexippus]|uniref:transcription initiation factor TFIID subunit 4 isoform X3 n=1 Tax=Danaus plexippus TaxID=13037 RepID=UPI002AB1083C|nr:transcription initiation factor TFIID subunit 4 isoform X3 [Danaus plexippus]